MDTSWLVVIIGPPTVVKMTVGQALRDRTGFALHHNHMMIDLLTPFFEFGSEPFERLVTDTGTSSPRKQPAQASA
jgi:hypothetical protein